MKKLNSFLLLALFVMGSMFVTGCKEDEEPQLPKSIVETVTSDAQFSTLAAALTKANLVTTLEADGPFTVFAPTNTAFNNLFATLGINGIEDLTAAQLEPILLYHVVSGDVKSGDLSNSYVSTVSPGPMGSTVSVKVGVDNGVSLNGSSSVTTADVDATNGVIHIIDEVLLPPDVVALALGNDNFTTLVAALTRADLTFDFVGFLSENGPFTVFAPTNAAFQALLDSNADWNSLDDIPVATLDAVLKYHVVSGTNFDSGTISNGLTLTTAGGSDLTVNVESGTVSLVDPNGTSTVIIADVQGTNGVVHAIDRVLIP